MKKLNELPSARMIFARNMKAGRQALGLSQEELADRCGLHRTYIGSVERGERNISVDNMERIALVLGKTLSSILEASEETRPSRSGQ
ncbi:helix-turn-helix domain-containing protein [Ferrigenium kumadai]|uniref:helix-turn-helix domain-containing protein n=1 Tax=Ferrigenium kumadai TaxID=1682490 RepID=UPI001BB3A33C|nr:helix-turn-helix transcriptional regulator [Ferrigenium kumadai]